MSALRSYEDFEPLSEWIHAEGFRTLLIRLPGFKRNQLKVQITETNHVKISGERPLEHQRWSRFVKQFPLPEHCTVTEIRAKFENEELHVRFPIAQVAPSTTMHISPSSPMEKAATELREKTQEGDSKSRKAVPEEEFLQKEQKQPDAKEEVGHKEHPKAATELREKTQEGDGKSRKAVPEGEFLQKEQKQPDAKEHPKAATEVREKTQEGDGKSRKAVAEGESLQKEQKQLEAKEEVGHKEHPKANGDREKKQEKLQDKEKTEEGRSNGEKTQAQQVSPKLKTDDTFRLEKETEKPAESKGVEMMAKYGINNLLMELTPDKKILLVNVAVSILVFLGIGLYLMYKREDK